MLVTQNVGKLAGQEIDLSFEAVVSGYKQGTITVPEQYLALVRKVAEPEPDSGERAPLVTPVGETPAPRRRGGWPLGKPRGPRTKPEVLA